MPTPKTRFLFICLALGVIGFLAWWFYSFADNIPIPRQAKLIDCTGTVATCSFTAPRGRAYNLVLSGPDYPAEFTSKVEILSQAKPIVEFQIDSRFTRTCNWLQSKGIPVGFYFLAHSVTNHPGLEQYLAAGRTYEFRFTFQQPPPLTNSLWLTWQERSGDK